MNRIGTFKELYFLLKTPAFNKDSFLICGYGKLGKTVVAVLQNVFNKKVFITDSNLELIKDLKNGISLDNIQCEKMIPIISIANKDVCNLWEEKLIKKGYSEQDIYCYKSYSYSPGGVIDEINLYYKKGYYSYKDNCYKKIVDVNKEMGKKIKHNKPFFASRWGSVEGSVLVNDKIGNNISLYDLQNNAGVFPIENKNVVKKYIEYSKKAAFQIDYLLLGLWCHNLEELKYWYSPNAKLCRWAIGPGKGNWLKYLANKKVLVIHPFANLMQKQYQQKKDLLFSKKNVLPNFEFIPYKAYNTLGGGGQLYADWVQTLEAMQNDIAKIDFDVALIGCGAYGMPLGGYIKSELNKGAIHIGGSLQLFFGIKGKRWDDANIYNEHWVRPTDDLKPKNYKSVEDGCYW